MSNDYIIMKYEHLADEYKENIHNDQDRHHAEKTGDSPRYDFMKGFIAGFLKSHEEAVALEIDVDALNEVLKHLTKERILNLDKIDEKVSSLADKKQVDDLQATLAKSPTPDQIADAVWSQDINKNASCGTTAKTLRDAKSYSQSNL